MRLDRQWLEVQGQDRCGDGDCRHAVAAGPIVRRVDTLGWWPLPAGLGVNVLAYARMVSTAAFFGDLAELAFDIYRGALYQTLGWMAPSTLSAEFERESEVTTLLWRGYRPEQGTKQPSPRLGEYAQWRRRAADGGPQRHPWPRCP